MSLPDQTPKLPKLPFLAGDAALLALAWLIVHESRGPLSNFTVGAVTLCVIAACIVGIIPFMTDYARKQDEALDERQRGLEALSRTVNTAAEQISIAANGLHEIVELSHKHLKHAEQLPHKLQEKIAEFNAQLDNAREDDREELEKELTELRASESERLQLVTDKINKAVTELTRLEAATQKHVATRVDVVSRASETVAKAHADATIALNDSLAAITRELANAQARALGEIDTCLTARTAEAVAALDRAAAQAAATLTAAAAAIPAPAAASVATPPPAAVAAESPAPGAAAEIASPPKRPRKARRDEPAPVEPTAASAEPVPASTAVEPPPSPEPAAATPAAPEPPAIEPAAAPEPVAPAILVEPPPVPAESIAHIAPVAPASADPFPPPVTALSTVVPVESAVEPAAAETLSPSPEPATPPPAAERPAATETVASESVGERPSRKRAARKPAAPPEPVSPPAEDSGEFTLQSDDPPVTSADFVESVISSDGATRLIATAYIGIGNRLFIRGEGPGLSWDKGVPLQFVSIGKWRWETSDAAAAIRFKLYKNDDIECAGLGLLTLEPGHQQEVTAKF